MKNKILELKKEFDSAEALSSAEVLKEINILTRQLKKLGPKERSEYGKLINELKKHIENSLKEEKKFKKKEWIDLTAPGKRPRLGHLHPTTQIIRELNDFFSYLGYSIADGPEIETNEYNFEKLNLPKDHPARDLQDTLYIKSPELLMRTHTSSVEARAMVQYGPPIRIVAPGKCYRNETTNKSNNSVFYQYEALVIDKGITMAHLKWALRSFMQRVFGEDVVLRFRCKYYPQVEPGMGIDMQCQFCKGSGCDVCKHVGWLEIGGSGMVHPNVLRSCNIDPKKWSGFAFGISPDRSAMQRFDISDIRNLYNGSIVYV